MKNVPNLNFRMLFPICGRNLLTACLLLFPVALTAGGGDCDSYQGTFFTKIYSISDFSQLNESGGSFILCADLDFQSQTYFKSVVPKFYGYLDGNGFKIRNLVINARAEMFNGSFVGLFGQVNTGSLQRLSLENIRIRAVSPDLTSLYVGILAGRIDQTNIGGVTINNSVVELSGAGAGTFAIVGGLVGDVSRNSTSQVRIKNVSILSSGSALIHHIGGIAGRFSSSNMEKSEAEVSVTLDSPAADIESNLGGAVGFLNAWSLNLKDVHTKSHIKIGGTVAESAMVRMGGVVGKYQGSTNSQIIRVFAETTFETERSLNLFVGPTLADGTFSNGTCVDTFFAKSVYEGIANWIERECGVVLVPTFPGPLSAEADFVNTWRQIDGSYPELRPLEETCDGDVNGDERIDGADLSIFLNQYGRRASVQSYSNFNSDELVSGGDLSILLAGFQRGVCSQ